uniref:coiled-coil domain-containing protein 106a n=1 Tax=Doryrhamphus excisus TaxID=161450 RepID=UPI0025ADED54|nr:coiled-coil domain-containing protein 106a [Doryrhamphus excisus]XP_057912279.1 coiled-coil domain-containing protein 106a [Doryrhamphus excisus]XP_057912280.1 coiled-coil domain-containing protein 106a [Doryrhamphus excisus]XP_057912281.1 coiled-coil domain-containing protein 106a [Doryrhamphus excisus]
MENGNRCEVASASKSNSASLHLQTPKNEEIYEITMPLEESSFEQQGFLQQSDANFDESLPSAAHSSVSNSFRAMTNLRTQLQISLEKNSWLQKRIEDLEEERDFLRCQLDRFISSTKSQGDEPRRFTWRGRREDERPAEQQTTDSPRFPSHQFLQRRPAGASAAPAAPAKKHVSDAVSTHLASMNALFTSAPSQALLQGLGAAGHSSSGSGSGAGSASSSRALLNGHGSLGADSFSLLGECDEYLEHDGYLEEEEMMPVEDAVNSNKQQQFKRRRVFRGLKERQRVKDAAGVLFRYKKILLTYQRLKNMSKAFQIHGVDRNTVASTTPIAELLLVAPEKVALVGEFDPSKEKLLDYARRCYTALDEETLSRVQALKKNNLLLPISYRFRH